jgi:hypothetical protein
VRASTILSASERRKPAKVAQSHNIYEIYITIKRERGKERETPKKKRLQPFFVLVIILHHVTELDPEYI